MGVSQLLRDARGDYLESGWAKVPLVTLPLQVEANGFLYVVKAYLN